MPTKPTVEIQTANTQAKTRKLVTLRDTHRSARFPEGRPWWGYAEMPAERGGSWGIVGSLAPGNHENPFGDVWEAPWYPDSKWMSSNVETGKVTINYVGMIGAYTQATQKYYNDCAQKANDNKWEAPALGAHVDSRFRAVLGDVPQSPKIPQAAQAGDPWLLGVTTEINEGLSKLLKETTYGSFPVAPSASSDGTMTVTKGEIAQMIADALAAQAAVQRAPRPDRSAQMAKARAAKDAKKAQAQAKAA